MNTVIRKGYCQSKTSNRLFKFRLGWDGLFILGPTYAVVSNIESGNEVSMTADEFYGGYNQVNPPEPK